MLSLYALLPLFCYCIGALISTQFKLNEDTYKEIRASLDRGEYHSPREHAGGVPS